MLNKHSKNDVLHGFSLISVTSLYRTRTAEKPGRLISVRCA